ncbi:MAG: S1/P1 nuclease, partial [Xanthomonadales bacterium]
LNPVSVRAWGAEGHFQVAKLAMQALDPTASAWLHDALGTDDVAAISKACNWPDRVRDTPAWDWSAPQHYVNIPRSASHYDRERDCPDGLCVTEAIKKYTGQLGNPRLDKRKQWEAFAWLCHLVGDLHQPLHAGYRDDRGGNKVQVSYQGETINLHRFWDRTLIQERLGTNGYWRKPAFPQLSGQRWNPAETDTWTDESHRLAGEAAYPPGEIIHANFAENSWLLIRQQWLRAGQRLARILNAVVGEGEIELGQ